MTDEEEKNTSSGGVNPGNPLPSFFPKVLSIIASMAKALILTIVDGVKNLLGSSAQAHGESFVSKHSEQTTGNFSGLKKGSTLPSTAFGSTKGLTPPVPPLGQQRAIQMNHPLMFHEWRTRPLALLLLKMVLRLYSIRRVKKTCTCLNHLLNVGKLQRNFLPC